MPVDYSDQPALPEESSSTVFHAPGAQLGRSWIVPIPGLGLSAKVHVDNAMLGVPNVALLCWALCMITMPVGEWPSMRGEVTQIYD